MPIVNMNSGKRLAEKVTVADNFFSRMVGLLGKTKPETLWIVPCSGIHTFGMRFSIDVIFLDGERKVVKLDLGLTPNHLTKIIPSAKSVLELPAGTIDKSETRICDRLEITGECSEKKYNILQKVLHYTVNMLLAVIWGSFVLLSFTNWKNTGEPLGIGLFIVNTILVILFLTRRESKETSNRSVDWVVALTTVVMSLSLKQKPDTTLLGGTSSVGFQSVGILAMVISLCSLGRSFGIVPANRGIQCSGLYSIVRHPLYASEMLFYIGYLFGNLSYHNLILVIGIFLGQLQRTRAEEHLLSRDGEYIEYLKLVRYRFLPNVL